MRNDSVWRPRWHQRVPLVRDAREALRSAFFRTLGAIARTDDARSILNASVGDLARWRPAVPHAAAVGLPAPYPELGRETATDAVAGRKAIFITARFRSGSTLLWNIFRHVDGCTAYYEPLNERRWFDASHRGLRTDPTHHDVDNYWMEYDGLERLGAHYHEDWIRHRLYMDEQSWDPDLVQYVRILAEGARARPVLQFNRIDFRLAWFRHNFREASLIHLYRNPRDQWCSTFRHGQSCPPDAGIAEFANYDGFYLLPWATDLKYRFPFLDPATVAHPYRLFYYIWKLSYWWGASYAHHSLSYEALVASPEWELRRLFQAIGIADVDWPALVGLVVPAPRRWPSYAPDAWFRKHEEACEEVLADFFSSGALPAAATAQAHMAM